MNKALFLLPNNDIRAFLRRFSISLPQFFIILMLVFTQLGLSHRPASAAGTTFYVDNMNPACSDATTGPQGTAEVPFCTLSRGALKAATPGDTVRVIAGTYAETVYPNSGTAGNPISFLANPGVTVTGQPGTSTVAYAAFALGAKSYVVIDGFNITNTSSKGIYVDSSDHITITNNHVSYAGSSSLFHPYEQGIYLKNTTYSTISGNTSDHNTCIGIRVVLGDHNVINNNLSYSNYSVVESDAAGIELSGSSYNTIANNITYSNEDSGINVYLYVSTTGTQVSSTHNLVIGNLTYENGDHGIDNNNSPYNYIISNTVQGNGTTGINFEGEATTGSHHAVAMNNIIVGNGFTPPSKSFGGNLRVDSASIAGTSIDYNLFDRQNATVQIIWDNENYTSLADFKLAAPSQEVHGLEGDALFVNPVASALREEGKPYVGAGIVGDYKLKFGSPAIDSANADAPLEPNVLYKPVNDIVGNSRIDDPGTANTGAGVRTYDDRGAYEFLPSGVSLPIVTTQSATAVTTTSVTGNGTITATGLPNPTQHGFVWSTSSNPTLTDNKTEEGQVSGIGVFTSAITGLTPGTLYHVRAYATNSTGTAYGQDVTFTTLYIAPTVSTQAVTGLSSTSATGNGTVNTLGVPNPTQHGFVWGTSANPTLTNSKTTDGPVDATGPFTSTITGLTPNTLYHIRAYATNSAGTVYGEYLTFTTLLASTITTQPVTNITTNSAAGNGTISALGSSNPTQHGFVWSTSANPTTSDSKTTDGPVSAPGTFTSNLTGLTPGILYHVRAYATSTAGTVYGNEVTFTTLLVPTITTQAVSAIGTTTATGNGTLTVLGVPNPTQHGVVWSTSANPTTSDSKTTDGPASATGAFTSAITGLASGMQYHVRAYATNAAGTVYGNDVVFTTLPSTNSITTPSTNSGAGNDDSATGTALWQNTQNIKAADNNYAQTTVVNATSHYLEGTNYGFAIPSNAIINGIVVTMGRYESGASTGTDVRDSVVRLIKGGVITGNNKANTSTEWPTAQAPATYGGPADLWGTTWTPADINASNFGVALSVNSVNDRIAYVDYIQIAVTYTVTTYTPSVVVNCGSGSPTTMYGSSITCVATVMRGSGTYTPSGTVSWTTSGSGTFVTSPCVLSGTDGTATCSVTYTPSQVGGGSHLITATYAGDQNFSSNNGGQTVIVNKKAASVTPKNASKALGASDPILTGTLTGFLPTDNITATYSRTLGETVDGGPYTITATLSPANALLNYDVTYNTGVFNISLVTDLNPYKSYLPSVLK